MRELEELTTEDLNDKGCLRLILEWLKIKMLDKDEEWVKSDECLKVLSYLPPDILPKIRVLSGAYQENCGTFYAASEEPLGIHRLQAIMLEHIKTPQSGKYNSTNPWHNAKNRQWVVTSPDGVTELTSDLKTCSLKHGLNPGTLRYVLAAGGEYKGYKVRRVL